MRRTSIALVVLLALVGGMPVYGQEDESPPRIVSGTFEIARYIGGRQLAAEATWGSIFALYGIFPLWDTPIPFDPTTDLAKELDIVLCHLVVYDSALGDPNSNEDVEFFYQVLAYVASVGPPEPPPLYGITDTYVSAFAPPPVDPNTVLISFLLQIPEFSGANQARLRGTQNYDAAWTVDFRVANSDSPEEGEYDLALFTIFAIENATLRPPDPPPIADAGSNQVVPAGSTVVLDGSRSFDSSNLGFDPLDPNIFEKDSLRYTWEWLSGPEEVDPEPDPTDPANARVTLTTVTTSDNPYVYRLLVSDEVNALPATAIVYIYVQASIPVNRAPIAAITGPAGSVTVGTTVQLSGLASSDPDGDALSYRWRQTNSIGGELLADEIESSFQPLNGVNTAVASWKTTAAGTYYFSLVVTDPSGLTSSVGPFAVNVVTTSTATAQIILTSQQRETDAAPAAESSTNNTVTTACGAGGLFPLAFLPGLLWAMRNRR